MTVRLLPHFPFRPALCRICGGKWGGENGPAAHCIKGALRDTRSSPKILGDLKTIMMIKSYGGRRVSRLSPSIVTHALNACSAAKREAKRTSIEDDERPTKNRPRRENPKTRSRRKGLGANPGHKRSQNSHSPSTNAFRKSSQSTWG